MMALYLIGIMSMLVSYFDCRYRLIPNKYCAIIFFISLYIAFNNNHIITGLCSFVLVFLITAMLFKLHIFGAGDSKLSSAFSLALLPEQLIDAVILTLFFGGFLAVFYLIKDRLILKKERADECGLPYGVAISLGFYITIINNSI